MKKLLTSLTILALISPITMANVNAQDSQSKSASTNASVAIVGEQGTFNITASDSLTFPSFELVIGQSEYKSIPGDNSNVILTVSDTRFGKVEYDVKAKLIGATAEDTFKSFPKGTSFTLTQVGPITKTEENELIEAPDSTNNTIIFTVKDDGGSDESYVLEADRTSTPYQGAGEWKVTYEAGTLTIPHDEDLLVPGITLGGTILWTMSSASS